MEEQDKIRLVGELVTVIGAVIMLLLEVSAGGVRVRPSSESPRPAAVSMHFLFFWPLPRSRTSSGLVPLAILDRPSSGGRSMSSCECPFLPARIIPGLSGA